MIHIIRTINRRAEIQVATKVGDIIRNIDAKAAMLEIGGATKVYYLKNHIIEYCLLIINSIGMLSSMLWNDSFWHDQDAAHNDILLKSGWGFFRKIHVKKKSFDFFSKKKSNKNFFFGFF